MTRPPRAPSLSDRLGTIGALLMLLALGALALTLSFTQRLEGGAAAVNEAGRLRMQTWRLAQTLGAGDAAAVPALVREFEQSLALLDQGNLRRPLAVPKDPSTDAAFATVLQHWAGLRTAWLAAAAPPPPQAVAAQAALLVADIDAYVHAIEARLTRWTSLLTLCQFGLMGLALAGGLALIYAAYAFVLGPLGRLQGGLAAVEAGDLSVRVDAAGNAGSDEFQRLSAGFNRMADTLQGFYRDLEHKVQEKTETLRAERERLAILYEASGFVGSAPTLQALAQGFASRVRRAARADAVLLRWHDDARRQHVLLAADCVPAELLEDERCLKDGDCHCGQPAAPGGAGVIPIRSVAVDLDPSPCSRFGFTRVVTVPVRLHDQLLGEVDLLYRGLASELPEEDRALLASLASHLASGMESVRVAALEREAAVAEERGLLARELHDSIAQGLAFLKIQVQLMRGAVARGDVARTTKAVDEIDAGVHESLDDVRELLLHFRTRTRDEDIVPALKTTLTKFEHQTGLPTQLAVHGDGVPLPPDVQVQLLHVVQEALSNVRKHARATQVWLDVQRQPHWCIEVGDDGIGLDTACTGAGATHVGLQIMRERADGIGATLQWLPRAGGGTRVLIELPELPAQHEPARGAASALRPAVPA